MNDFFTTTNTETYTIRTTKGDFTFTAMDIAKIVAFGDRHIAWDGSDTWISSAAVADMLALFCTEEGEERGQLRQELCSKVDTYTDKADDDLKAIINQARDIVTLWGSLKLYTCLSKKFQGSEERFINLDKLESMLGIELGDKVRERLTNVSATKDVDGDWVFESATGRSYRDTATIGVLVEIRDAVNLFDDLLRHSIDIAKQGFSTFEEIARESFSIKIDRMTQGDIDDIVAALKAADLTPDRYTVYFTKHNEFGLGISSEVADRWDFAEVVAEFATKKPAAEFRAAANKNYSIEKKRQRLLKVITETEQQLADLREEYLALLD